MGERVGGWQRERKREGRLRKKKWTEGGREKEMEERVDERERESRERE